MLLFIGIKLFFQIFLKNQVKWNLSHAIGVAMRQFLIWRLEGNALKKCVHMFYDTLLDLFVQSNNFKVRINACIALMSAGLSERSVLEGEDGQPIYLRLWTALFDAFGKLNNQSLSLVDANNELQHKNTLIHQVSLFFQFFLNCEKFCKFIFYLKAMQTFHVSV